MRNPPTPPLRAARPRSFAGLAVAGLALGASLAACADPATIAAPVAERAVPVAAVPAAAIPAGPYVPGQSYFGRNGYVEYVAGDAPVILTAPHGGNLIPSEIPDRTDATCGGNADRATDTNLRELVRAMQQRYHARFGRYPHVVLLHLRRTKLDANRPLLEAACGDPEAEIAWHEWHDFIGVARQAVLASTGKGWYMDMHGHTHTVQRLELGYLLTGKELDLSDATLDATAGYEANASMQTVSLHSPLSFSALLRGPKSIGTMFADSGYAAIPSATDPSPRGAPYFTGGYNMQRHTCSAYAALHGGTPGGAICGVQIEANYTGVRDSEANRTRFADVTAAILEEYLGTHWGLQLRAGDPPPPPPPPPNTPPVAALAASCSGLTCTFTDASTDADGTITSWRWTFGDGASSTAQHPTRTYAAGGSYTVTLTVTDDDGATGSASSAVTVTAPPAPNTPPTASFRTDCSGLTCTFTDASTDADGTIANWQWSFGDGGSSSARSPTHAYAAGGTYTVTLSVTDDDGARASSASSVTVTPPPSIILTVRGSKVKGNARADLTWTGATSTSVDVYRNGSRRTTTANDGAYTDTLNKLRGSFTYRVCHAGTSTCSNSATVSF